MIDRTFILKNNEGETDNTVFIKEHRTYITNRYGHSIVLDNNEVRELVKALLLQQMRK